jgi:uncharacterized protein DUF5670
MPEKKSGLGTALPTAGLSKGGVAVGSQAPQLCARSPWAMGRGVGGVYWTMSAILFVLWVLGLVSGSTEGRWVHLLLIFSMVTLILALARRGRGALA